MIQSGRPAVAGSLVELRRGEHVIVARVMWRDGSRLGLQSDHRLPVEEILSLGSARNLQLVASDGTLVERRKAPRTDPDRARQRGRALEFGATLAIAAMLAAGSWGMAHQALARPLAAVRAALPG